MKRMIKASLLSDFTRYHEDADNYHSNPEGFDAMYDILNQYGSDEEDVREVFKRAPYEVQVKMVDLIKPRPKFGSREYARQLYRDALDNNLDDGNVDYCQGVVDAVDALIAGGWFSGEGFRD